jgi:hypothetical protein
MFAFARRCMKNWEQTRLLQVGHRIQSRESQKIEPDFNDFAGQIRRYSSRTSGRVRIETTCQMLTISLGELHPSRP